MTEGLHRRRSNGVGADVLLDDHRVRKLTFTGSTEVGRMLAGRAATTMKRVSLELGGHAPFVVFDDADPARAAKHLYTRDLDRAVRIAEALRFGIVGVNDINPTAAAAPFGGIKDSGLGREGGPAGIEEYLDTKLVGLSVGA